MSVRPLGGFVIGYAGLGWVYAFNAVSYSMVIAALLMMRLDSRPGDASAEGAARGEFTLSAALEGLRFVFRSPLIRSTMLLDFFATFFSSATALLPIFAQDVLHVGARGYGWLYSAPAAGAVITSGAMVPVVDRIEHRGKVLDSGSRRLRRCHHCFRLLETLLADLRMPGRDRDG